ncbi:MAG: hypothetical protein ACRCXT_06795 [Paraclostridium sp.]
MEETNNYKLKKQDELDFYDVHLVNENLDTIDLAIKEAKDTADSKASSTHTHDASDINGIATDAESTSFDNSTSNMFSTNVQSAVEEVNDKTNANKVSILKLEEKVENIDSSVNEIVNITVKCSDATEPNGQIITIKNTKENTTVDYIYENSTISIKVLAGTEYEVYVNEKNGYIRPILQKYVAGYGVIRNINFYYEKKVKYGIKVSKNNSDPRTRVEYTHDAVGFVPAKMNYSTDEFEYGSWANVFFVKKNRPVMLKYNGEVDYELDRNDTSLKVNGEASDISNNNYAGNAMSEIPLGWLKQYEDSNYEYHIVSNYKVDDTYTAYPFMNSKGEVKDVAYMAMFEGSFDNSKLRSIADKTVMVNTTRQQEIDRAVANGVGWYTLYWSMWDYINVLGKLISKSTDSQTSFGNGRCDATSAMPTGTLKNKSQFYGKNDNTSAVKLFYVENLYGNAWMSMGGMVTNASKEILVKMTPPYNVSGSGYTSTGVVPSGTSGGYINSVKVGSNIGTIPKVASGSATTYYTDGLWFSANCYALAGGRWVNSSRVGCSSVIVADSASYTAAHIGSCLSFIQGF